MATMNVSLPDDMKEWVEARASGPDYANTSDYVRDLIRRDQQRSVALAELQAAVDEGLTGGPTEPWVLDDFLTAMRGSDG